MNAYFPTFFITKLVSIEFTHRFLWKPDKSREGSHIDFVHEKRHMDVLLETPNPPSETSRTWLFILQAWLSVVYKSIKVHLGQSQELIMSVHIYWKFKYTYKNAGLCILCIDDFKILKMFIKLSKFSTIFHRETSQAPTPPPPPTSIWRFSWTKSICDASPTYSKALPP